MGFAKPLDVNSISHQLWITRTEINSPRNDGFTQFELKKDLYKIHQLLESILQESPKFVGEEEFLLELEKSKVVRILEK